MEISKVIYTGSIPQCPYCQKPTKRVTGFCMTTDMYFPPIYDENGINTNPDRNTVTESYDCLGCGKSFVIAGNNADGFEYRQ